MTTLSRAFLLVALTATSGAWAAGFAVDTQSARATGLATAVAGMIDDPSSIFYNPAGLSRTEGLQIQLGDTLIFPSVSFNPAGEGPEMDSEFTALPAAPPYVSYKPIERVAFGLGLSTPFGNHSKWPEGWAGAQLTQRASLAVFDMAAVGSAELHPRFRVGASFRVLRGTVDIERQVNFVDSTGGVQLGGAGWGLGWSVGGQVDIVQDVLTLGANYRSGSKVDFDGQRPLLRRALRLQQPAAGPGDHLRAWSCRPSSSAGCLPPLPLAGDRLRHALRAVVQLPAAAVRLRGRGAHPDRPQALAGRVELPPGRRGAAGGPGPAAGRGLGHRAPARTTP